MKLDYVQSIVVTDKYDNVVAIISEKEIITEKEYKVRLATSDEEEMVTVLPSGIKLTNQKLLPS